MPVAGDIITVPTSPGANVGTVEQTSDSATFTTTEIVLMTITVPLVTGRRYRIVHVGIIASSAAGTDDVQMRLREDTVSGTQLQQQIARVSSTGFGWPASLFREFTASVTGSKTFVVTGQRLPGGAGNTMRLEADTIRPSYLYVDYTRDG